MSDLSAPIEAMLMMASDPIPAVDLATALDVTVDTVLVEINDLIEFYEQTARGFELREVAGGWRYFTHRNQAEFLKEWVVSDQQAKLSQAALETLAVIAYMQPVSRSRVSAVRGVNVDGVVRTLATRGLIETSKTDPETGAALFTTTSHFLEHLGLNTLDELPDLAPQLPEATALEEELNQLATVAQPLPLESENHGKLDRTNISNAKSEGDNG